MQNKRGHYHVSSAQPSVNNCHSLPGWETHDIFLCRDLFCREIWVTIGQTDLFPLQEVRYIRHMSVFLIVDLAYKSHGTVQAYPVANPMYGHHWDHGRPFLENSIHKLFSFDYR